MNWNDFVSHLSKVAQKGSPPEYWDEFLKEKYQGGKKKVPNPNPKTRDQFQQVAVSTAMKFEQGTKRPVYEKLKEEYQQWLGGKLRPKTPAPKFSLGESPPTFLDFKHSKDRFSKLIRSINNTMDEDHEFHNFFGENGPNSIGGDLEHTLSLLVGVEALTKVRVSIRDTDSDEVSVEVEGNHVENMLRVLRYEDGEFVVYNDNLRLKDDAPEGLGTRIFANQVIEAYRANISRIKCVAYRNDNDGWVGYKVWPKLGYDGEIPEEVLRKPAVRAFLARYYPRKYDEFMVSDILKVPGGEEIWDKHGDTFEAEFSLHDNDNHLSVLQAYLDKKANKAGKTVSEYLKMGRKIV